MKKTEQEEWLHKIKSYILKKEIQLDFAHEAWNTFVTMHCTVRFSESTFKEVEKKVKNRMKELEDAIKNQREYLKEKLETTN